ncbi:hypothetical protein ACX80W_07465 [Arthrobacter sp. TMN-37]
MEPVGRPRLSGSTGHPPRRPSPAVYRRRRLVAAILALLVVAALAVGAKAVATAFAGDGPAPAAEPAPAGEGTASAPAPKPPAAAKCDPAKVVVEAVTDAKAYGPKGKPVFTLVVRNESAAPCAVNVGTSQMEFQVTSAADRIFSSVDCQDGSEDLSKDIAPGAEEKASFTWDRIRSMPGCEAVEAVPGPGTYTLTTRLGSRTSAPAAFVLE